LETGGRWGGERDGDGRLSRGCQAGSRGGGRKKGWCLGPAREKAPWGRLGRVWVCGGREGWFLAASGSVQVWWRGDEMCSVVPGVVRGSDTRHHVGPTNVVARTSLHSGRCFKTPRNIGKDYTYSIRTLKVLS
jgi:hypothetical protein